MTEFVDVPGGRIVFDVTGSGLLKVLSHGVGVRRQDYRFLAPILAQAGCALGPVMSSARDADRAGDHLDRAPVAARPRRGSR